MRSPPGRPCATALQRKCCRLRASRRLAYRLHKPRRWNVDSRAGNTARTWEGEILSTKTRHLTNNAARAFRALATAGVVVGIFASPAAALDSVVFQANWLIQGENAYMVAGRDKGFYREEGIDLD